MTDYTEEFDNNLNLKDSLINLRLRETSDLENLLGGVSFGNLQGGNLLGSDLREVNIINSDIINSDIIGGTFKTAVNKTRIIVDKNTNNIYFFNENEATPRVVLGTSNNYSGTLYFKNPANSLKDVFYVNNFDGNVMEILNQSTADSVFDISHAAAISGIFYNGTSNLSGVGGQEAHWYIKKTGTGTGRVMYLRNEGTGTCLYLENNVGSVGSTDALIIEHYGTGDAIDITSGDFNLGGGRFYNITRKAGAPNAAECGTYGLVYDTTNNELYFNNNNTLYKVAFTAA